VTVTTLLCDLIQIYIIVLFVRALFSWFPPPSGGMATFYRILLDLTEPVLAPLRRIIPPAGAFNLSFLVLIIFLVVIQRSLCG